MMTRRRNAASSTNASTNTSQSAAEPASASSSSLKASTTSASSNTSASTRSRLRPAVSRGHGAIIYFNWLDQGSSLNHYGNVGAESSATTNAAENNNSSTNSRGNNSSNNNTSNNNNNDGCSDLTFTLLQEACEKYPTKYFSDLNIYRQLQNQYNCVQVDVSCIRCYHTELLGIVGLQIIYRSTFSDGTTKGGIAPIHYFRKGFYSTFPGGNNFEHSVLPQKSILELDYGEHILIAKARWGITIDEIRFITNKRIVTFGANGSRTMFTNTTTTPGTGTDAAQPQQYYPHHLLNLRTRRRVVAFTGMSDGILHRLGCFRESVNWEILKPILIMRKLVHTDRAIPISMSKANSSMLCSLEPCYKNKNNHPNSPATCIIQQCCGCLCSNPTTKVATITKKTVQKFIKLRKNVLKRMQRYRPKKRISATQVDPGAIAGRNTHHHHRHNHHHHQFYDYYNSLYGSSMMFSSAFLSHKDQQVIEFLISTIDDDIFKYILTYLIPLQLNPNRSKRGFG